MKTIHTSRSSVPCIAIESILTISTILESIVGKLRDGRGMWYNGKAVTGDRATQECDLSTVPDAQRHYGTMPNGTGWRRPTGVSTPLE
jgi:hypothetical protein